MRPSPPTWSWLSGVAVALSAARMDGCQAVLGVAVVAVVDAGVGAAGVDFTQARDHGGRVAGQVEDQLGAGGAEQDDGEAGVDLVGVQIVDELRHAVAHAGDIGGHRGAGVDDEDEVDFPGRGRLLGGGSCRCQQEQACRDGGEETLDHDGIPGSGRRNPRIVRTSNPPPTKGRHESAHGACCGSERSR
jgi:hypothetical protein